MGVSLMNMLWPFVKCTFPRVVENSSLCTTHTSSVSRGFAEQIMPNLRILCYNGSLVIWTVVSLTAAKLKPFVFSMSGFFFSYTANGPHRKDHFQQFLSCCVVIRYRKNMFTIRFLAMDMFFWVCYSGFHPSCHTTILIFLELAKAAVLFTLYMFVIILGIFFCFPKINNNLYSTRSIKDILPSI
jgi:hypothetical protein